MRIPRSSGSLHGRRLLTVALFAAMAMGAAAAASAQVAPDSSFSLEPGDVLKVTVWREKDLACECKVDELGRLTLPMLGIMRVAGRPWPVLRDSLLGEYSRELKNPSVTLIPMRRVQVLGEVTKPGNYLADPTLSLAGLIALAGGATPLGDLHHVRVVRDGRTIINGGSIEGLLMQGGVRSNDQIFVDRRSWLERNGAFVASTLISTASILVALIRR